MSKPPKFPIKNRKHISPNHSIELGLISIKTGPIFKRVGPIKSCPTLLNKPKMFFFHVCRGKNKIDSSRGAQMADHLEINSSSNLQSNMNKNIENKFENEFDLLIYYSILPKHLCQTTYDTNCFGTLLLTRVSADWESKKMLSRKE